METIGLLHFKCCLHLFVLISCPIGTSNRSGVVAAGIWDLVTLDRSVNAFGSWFAIFFKWIIFWTSCLHLFVPGSNKILIVHSNLFPFSAAYFLPLMLGILIHQMTINKSCRKSSDRFQIFYNRRRFISNIYPQPSLGTHLCTMCWSNWNILLCIQIFLDGKCSARDQKPTVMGRFYDNLAVWSTQDLLHVK